MSGALTISLIAGIAQDHSAKKGLQTKQKNKVIQDVQVNAPTLEKGHTIHNRYIAIVLRTFCIFFLCGIASSRKGPSAEPNRWAEHTRDWRAHIVGTGGRLGILECKVCNRYRALCCSNRFRPSHCLTSCGCTIKDVTFHSFWRNSSCNL